MCSVLYRMTTAAALSVLVLSAGCKRAAVEEADSGGRSTASEPEYRGKPRSHWVQQLGSKDAAARAEAALTVAAFGVAAESAMPALEKAQLDDDPQVRIAAWHALDAIDRAVREAIKAEDATPRPWQYARQRLSSPYEAAERARQLNNLRQIALAMIHHETRYGDFPPVAKRGTDGKPLLSWRVLILPYLDRQDLYQKFHLDEPWDSPHNLALLDRMPDVYRSPGTIGTGETSMLLFVGRGAAFASPHDRAGGPLRSADITDGLTNTIMVVEAGPDKAVPWTKPEDLPFQRTNPPAALGMVRQSGFLAVLFDGSVRVLPADIERAHLRALITPNGREPIDWAALDE